MQIESTAGSSPTTTRAPRLAWRTRSSPSRNGVPGATRASASLSGSLPRSTTTASYPAGAQATRAG